MAVECGSIVLEVECGGAVLEMESGGTALECLIVLLGCWNTELVYWGELMGCGGVTEV